MSSRCAPWHQTTKAAIVEMSSNKLKRYFSTALLIFIGFLVGSLVHIPFPTTSTTPRTVNMDRSIVAVETLASNCDCDTPAFLDKVILKKRTSLDTGKHTPIGHIEPPPATQKDPLFDKVRVLIWVATHPKNLARQATAVRDTWARRANQVLFMSSEDNSVFPTVGINVVEGRNHLTAKTMKSFKYIYQHHFNDSDWFMKADDDTYVVVENLRQFLSDKDPNEPHYYGHWFTWMVKGGYNSGGAGFIVSKETLRRFAAGGFGERCRQDGGFEDVEWGKCMQRFNVNPGDSRDKNGRTQFHGFTAEQFMVGDYPDWYPKHDKWGANKGIQSVSENAITFHHVPYERIYLMEYFIYFLRPHGVKHVREES